MFFGGGLNGNGVLIKLLEALLGEANCSHRSSRIWIRADLH